jgi:hypothetical protein
MLSFMFQIRTAETAFMDRQMSPKKILSFAAAILVVMGAFSACSMNESKIKSLVERELGSDLIVEKARLELDKHLGRRDSKLKSNLLDAVSKKINIEFTDILVEGRRARVKVRAQIPKLEDIGALFSEGRNIPKERILEMSLDEFIHEINKQTRRPASDIDLKVEYYEFYIDLEKNKEWVTNSDQIKKAYSRRNIVN